MHQIKVRIKEHYILQFYTLYDWNFSNQRPLVSSIFPQGFWISKNFGHPTSGSGGKKMFKRYLKSERTDKQTDRHTHGRIFWLIESINPEGLCFKNFHICKVFTEPIYFFLFFFFALLSANVERFSVSCMRDLSRLNPSTTRRVWGNLLYWLLTARLIKCALAYLMK